MGASKHLNAKPRTEVMEIRKSRCREVYDIGVKDEPHLFSLASGILTHNSKPNPMPESVNDRCTKAHEYIFLLTKSARYYYDAEAVKENATKPPDKRESVYKYEGKDPKYATKQGIIAARCKDYREIGRNRRSVWTITTKPFKEAHFATFPPEIPMTCIKAGSKIGDTVLDPFSGAGTVGMVCEKLDRNFIGIELNPSYVKMAEKRVDDVRLPILDYIRQG
jgi:DNA modification methylase